MASNIDAEIGDPDLGSRIYLVACIVALVLIFVTLDGGLAVPFSFVPLGLGLIALWFRWASGALMLLLTLSLLLGLRGRLDPPMRPLAPSDARALELARRATAAATVPAGLFLAAATIVFVGSYYRYLSLTDNVFPAERRTLWFVRSRALGSRPPHARLSGLASMPELIRLVTIIPAFLAVAYLAWRLLTLPAPAAIPVNTLHGEWGLLVLGLTVAALWALATTAFGYWHATNASAEESFLYLQDLLWRQTRREQARLQRWIVNYRHRAQRRKE